MSFERFQNVVFRYITPTRALVGSVEIFGQIDILI